MLKDADLSKFGDVGFPILKPLLNGIFEAQKSLNFPFSISPFSIWFTSQFSVQTESKFPEGTSHSQKSPLSSKIYFLKISSYCILNISSFKKKSEFSSLFY